MQGRQHSFWPVVNIHVLNHEGQAGMHHKHALVLQVKEIIYPLGATIDIRQVALGDQTMSVLEIWGAEYQENDCLLIKPDDRPLLEAIAARERCIMQVCSSSICWCQCALDMAMCDLLAFHLGGLTLHGELL